MFKTRSYKIIIKTMCKYTSDQTYTGDHYGIIYAFTFAVFAGTIKKHDLHLSFL